MLVTNCCILRAASSGSFSFEQPLKRPAMRINSPSCFVVVFTLTLNLDVTLKSVVRLSLILALRL